MKTLLDDGVRDAFVAAMVSALRDTIGIEAVSAVVPETATGPVAVTIDVSGDVRGPVTWVFPPDIALELVSRLLEEKNPPLTAVNDGATELANILTGYATEVLEAHGFRCEIGVPMLHEGAMPPGIHVHMTTAKGPIQLVLSLWC
ncbi:MAG TPA: chemotaxis protein CheX [Kofleriaceae bacterium]|nr:chemotaxis protein CheX [Kofleriaceae bacterium]